MINFDYGREDRISLPEAVLCQDKTVAMLNEIINELAENQANVLLTRLSSDKFAQLTPGLVSLLTYNEPSHTAFLGELRPIVSKRQVVIVTAGTADMPIAWEAWHTLMHLGIEATHVSDVGVAGVWRLEERLEEINSHEIIILIAGMDAAIVSVLGGLSQRPIIAVPTSTGYGVAEGGSAALNAILASCAPGITTVNIDNGYGAACAAVRILQGNYFER